jgi:hypothetical protein
MGECPEQSACPFFRACKTEGNKRLGLLGFVHTYCQGEKQEECMRIIVGYTLGDKGKVPGNMMPNGLPMAGTSHSNWPHDVMSVVRSARVMHIKTGHY